MLLFQYLQDADMSDATRTAAGKDETDARAMRRLGGCWRSRVSVCCATVAAEAARPESRAENAVYPETGPDRPW